MGLIQELPSSEQLTAILTPVIGDEAAGTGVAGVLKLLADLDIANLATSLSSGLDDMISGDISIDPTTFISTIREQFDEAISSLPSSPEELVAPFQEKLSSVKDLVSAQLTDNLVKSIGGLQNIQSLVPLDTRTLLSGATEGITQLKDLFISGVWGELRQWSESVQGLYDEIEPLFAGGAGAVEDRLVNFLHDKMADLVESILPQQQSLAAKLAGELDQAISAERVAAIQAIKSEVIAKFGEVKKEFENSNFSNTANLQNAVNSFKRLTGELEAINTRLSSALNSDMATAQGMIAALRKQFDDFDSVEVFDLGNIRDKFVDAIKSAEETLQGLKLEVVRETIEGVFSKINGVIDQFDLSQLTDKLNELQQKIQSVLDGLDAALLEAVASVRNTFNGIEEKLNSIVSGLGSYDEEGKFHFNVEQDLSKLLTDIRANIQDNIQPKLQAFKTSIDGTLDRIRGMLTSLQGQIETVKDNLARSLENVSAQLDSSDVVGKLEGIRQNLDDMLSGLGEIDFHPAVDPVVAQTHEMRDGLKKIDPSSLNDILAAALKVGAEVVRGIDFPGDITRALLNEIDEILEIPRNSLKEIEGNVERALEKLNALEPSVILKPLDDVFNPITEQLDALELEKLVEPLDDWHARIQEQLDKVSPAALLQPVVDLYDQLESSFASISPAALIQPLQEFIDSLKSELQGLDVEGIADELGDALGSVKSLMDQVSPENLFTPLINAFDKVVAALDGFNPGDLLQPFTDIFDKLMVPLDRLDEEKHVPLIKEAFASLRALPATFDPQHNLQKAKEKYDQVRDLLQQVGVGQIIADLKGPYDSMRAAFDAAQSGNVEISDEVRTSVEDDLNPLSNAIIGQAAAKFQQFETQLRDAFSQAELPDDTAKRYEELKPRLESLIPDWVRDEMGVDSIKEAFRRANPLNIANEVNRLYETFKKQVQNFDPRILQENVKETYENLKKVFSALDPEKITGGIQKVVGSLVQKLDGINLQILVDELQSLVDKVRSVVQGMNPRSVIDELETLASDLQDLFAGLKPSVILKELYEPSDAEPAVFQQAKDIVESFRPANLAEPLLEPFGKIQEVIAKIDIGIVLQPLNQRLEAVRDELEEGLKRTETAFSGMIGAIPV